MAENDAPQYTRPCTVEELADEIAETVFYRVSDKDRQARLRELIIEFAEEIQRRSIEP